MSDILKYTKVTTAKTLKDVYAWKGADSDWIFRGQSDSTWGLTTSLERELIASPEGLKHADERERGLVRRFQREAHHYLSHLPNDENIPEWLAIMQHYGSPTRLLDWTHSFNIALFFAVIDQRTPLASIWALNWKWIDDKLPSTVKNIYKKDRNCIQRKSYATIIKSNSGVAKLNSYRLSQRQAIQQSTFLVPLNATISFDNNLSKTLKGSAQKMLRRLDLPRKLRADIIKDQYRLNINHSTLFPGIDGFAKSLQSLLLLPDLLHPGDPWS
jgi:hypothetical protein